MNSPQGNILVKSRWHRGCGAFLCAALAAAAPVSAFTSNDVDAAYSAWWSAFSGNAIAWWKGAETIEMVEDVGNTSDINTMCNKFTTANGTDWSSVTANDDIAWACIAFVRAYTATGNTTYRTIAKNNFDMMYARGYDTTNGGIWWNTNNTYKASAANFSSSIAARLLATALGDTSYNTKALNIYNYGKAHLFNTSTGQVYDGLHSNGDLETTSYSYNQGTFAAAAWYSGDTANATLACDYVKNTYGVTLPVYDLSVDGAGFNGIFLRWAAKIGYNTAFRQAVADNAWARRNSSNLVNCQWDRATTSTDSWSCTDIVVAMKTVATSSDGIVFAQNSDYNGTLSQLIGPGSYTLSQLQALGVSDNWATSLRVPDGWRVTMYQNDNFGGTSWTFTADTANVGSAANDQMTSCKIDNTHVILYENAGYGGYRTQNIAKGTYTLVQMQALGGHSDWVTSLRIPSAYMVTLYQNDNFSGTSWWFTSSSSNIGSEANDQATSCQVEDLGVIFFQNDAYGGSRSSSIPKGTYTLAQLQALGVSNDWATSLRVPPGWTVIMYQNDNFGGTSWTFTSSSSNVGSAANDQMSSCKIQ